MVGFSQDDRQGDPEGSKSAFDYSSTTASPTKHKNVGSWINRRNRAEQKKHGQDTIVLHFTPTSFSWMNLVERFFRDITQDCIREGSFGSIQELVKAITDYLAERNLEPKAYKWKADGKQILEKIQRAREAMAKNNV